MRLRQDRDTTSKGFPACGRNLGCRVTMLTAQTFEQLHIVYGGMAGLLKEVEDLDRLFLTTRFLPSLCFRTQSLRSGSDWGCRWR